MKTGIIIQARMSSSRLPGKVLLKLAGQEVLWHMVKRCQTSLKAGQVIVATSTNTSDDVIEKFCQKNNFTYFRGDLNNVLNRFFQTADHFKLKTIVRVTSDCPLIDPEIIDQSIEYFENNTADYVSNCLDRTFPRGLDCEVFSMAKLTEANDRAATAYEQEHVTPYLIKNDDCLPIHVSPEYHGDFRLTLDTPKDYELLKIVYDKFYLADKIIDVKRVIAFLTENPEIVKINQDIPQKASIN